VKTLAWAAGALAAAALIVFLPLVPLAQIGGDVLIRVSFYGALAFIAAYSLMAAWWRSPMGRMIVALDFSVALALLSSVLRLDFGVTIPAWVLVRITVLALTLIPVTILSRLWLLGRLHGWRVRLPWRHPAEPDPATSASAERIADGDG
jgi:hypothetical protein